MLKRKRIVLSTFGSFGDIHPYMAIAMELKERGHDPVIATSALYREKIESAGLEFTELQPNIAPPQDQDPSFMAKIMDPRSGPRFLIEEVLFSVIRESYADLLRAIEGADLLISHPATAAGPLVAFKTGIAWISTVLAPMSFVSAHDPPVPPFWPWLGELRRIGPRATKVLLDFTKSRYRPNAVDQLRLELGIKDYGNPIFEGQHSPALVMALFSSVFAQPQPDWPPQTRVTGFPFYDGRRELPMPPELERFLESGDAPIVFTLGSSAVWVAQNFFHESIAAARILGKRAVLLIGDQRNQIQEALPEGMIAVDYAPYQSLLPRASIMVHHGGVGTTSQGLRAGIPTLIVPFAFDQNDNAAHAERLGTSRTLRRHRFSANRLAKELGFLLERPQYAQKAKVVSEQVKSETGTLTACNLIEEFLEGNSSETEQNKELIYAAGD